MFRGGIGNAVLAPISEVLARVVVQVTETVLAAKDVLIEKESFSELGGYLEKIQPVLVELQQKNVHDTPPMRVALESLEQEMKNAQDLIKLCGSKSRIYLLINCRTLVQQVQDITHEIGRCLSLIPMASMNISVDNRDITTRLMNDMQTAQFKAAVAEEAILDKIEMGIKDHRRDSEFANDLLSQIAKAVGMSSDKLSLVQELNEFKKEKEEAELQKNLAEAYQLDQIISVLSNADAVVGSRRSSNVGTTKISGNSQRLTPLSTFSCPLTKDIMSNPVEIASGQTFEHAAIEKWFKEGNKICPVTGIKLSNLEMKPNIALRSSIEEWNVLNTSYTISALGPRLQSKDEEGVQAALFDLYNLSQQGSRNRIWIAEAALIPTLVTLMQSSQNVIRAKTLAALCSLSIDNENKERIVAAGALPLTVRSLARNLSESRQAVALLLELSKVPKICEQIGKAHSCILLLVTLLGSDNRYCVEDSTKLLHNLSNSTQNVVQMAEANHFKPLVARLKEGNDMTRVLMASAIARMDLTEQSKASIAQEGATIPLVRMLSIGSLEAKRAALGALQKLSTLADIRQEMINAGLVPPLLRLLCSVTSSLVTLKEQTAATFANLATSSSSNCEPCEVLESEDTISQLLSLLNLASPDIQRHLLRALYGISTRHKESNVRMNLTAAGALQLLLPFCDSDDPGVRFNTVKLLYCLSGDGNGQQLCELLGTTYTKSIINLIMHSSDNDEKAAALGVLSNLPPNYKQVTDLIIEMNALPSLIKFISSSSSTSLSSSRTSSSLLENAVAVLLRFSDPRRHDTQQLAVNMDVIPALAQVLLTGSSLAKSTAATALAQFSSKSRELSRSAVTSKQLKKRRGCWSCFLSSQTEENRCLVHGGYCTVESSYCLVEANVVRCLVEALEDEVAQEAALTALSTLIVDDNESGNLENAIQVIVGDDVADGRKCVRMLVNIVCYGSKSVQVKEKALWMLEKIFRVVKYQEAYGNIAQMALIGGNVMMPLAARILAHLRVLHNQSSYF